jgi:hypothetical protein
MALYYYGLTLFESCVKAGQWCDTIGNQLYYTALLKQNVISGNALVRREAWNSAVSNTSINHTKESTYYFLSIAISSTGN